MGKGFGYVYNNKCDPNVFEKQSFKEAQFIRSDKKGVNS
jgi:hypothetical protein